jgi:hypothetical protein
MASFRTALLVGATALACGSPPPSPPSAVITATPEAVCQGDDYRTSVHLDGSKSSADLSLVYSPPAPNAPPLVYAWSFEGSEYMLSNASDPTSDAVDVTMAGDRPLEVHLQVQNAAGGVSVTLLTIAITPPDASGRCPLD